MKSYLIISILLLSLVSGIYAFPFANYGNIRVPDAYVMPHTMTRITAMNYFVPERGKGDMEYNWGGALNFGLLNHGEIGVVYTGDEILYGHVKAKIMRETISMPDVAIGIDNLFSKIKEKETSHPDIVDAANYRRTSIYAAVSKTTLLSGMPVVGDLPTRFTVGAGSHRFIGTVPFTKSMTGIFGAVQVEPAPNFTVITEIDGHNWNTAFEYRYKNISGSFILYRIEEWARTSGRGTKVNISDRGPKLGLSVSYLFDVFVDETLRGGFSPYAQVGTQLIDARDTASLDELQRIRRQRERAEEELQQIRRLLQD